MSEQRLLEEESLYAPLGIPSPYHRDWNIRVLDRDDLHEFSQSCGITILYLPLAAGQTHLCLLLSPTRRVLIVANGLSESETIYYAWRCFTIFSRPSLPSFRTGWRSIATLPQKQSL